MDYLDGVAVLPEPRIHTQDSDFTLCECGCGEPAPLATYSHAPRGWVKGQSKRFVSGHNRRGDFKPDRYEVRDCGYETPCWVWLLQLDEKGYGREGHSLAHRASFEREFGWLPPILHHRCGNPPCIRPDHLEPLGSHTEHIRVEQAARTHCRRNHAYSEHGYTRANGVRYCRACERENRRRREALHLR